MRKFFLAFVTVLWILAGIQIVTSGNKEDEQKLVEAFSQLNYTAAESCIEVSGTIDEDYMTVQDQEDFLKTVAEAIGIKQNYEISSHQEGNRKETTLYKGAAKAISTIKVVSIENEVEDNLIQTKQYFLMNLSMPDSVESAIIYKDMIQKALRNFEVTCDYNIMFEGQFSGRVSLEERNRITKQLLKEVEADVVSQNKTEDLYTIYAYTQLVEDYSAVGSDRINVNVVMNYDENENVTRIYVATPIMKQDY